MDSIDQMIEDAIGRIVDGWEDVGRAKIRALIDAAVLAERKRCLAHAEEEAAPCCAGIADRIRSGERARNERHCRCGHDPCECE